MENGHSAVRQLRYLPAVGSAYGVEVLSFAALRAMDVHRRRTQPQRPDFHVFALVSSGTGAHEADFHSYRLEEGSAVWIRPGMVHRWSDIDACDGPLVLFLPGFLPGFTAPEAAAPACWHLDRQRLSLALLAAEHLDREHDAAVRTPRLASPALLSHLLAALILRALPDPPASAATTGSGGRQTEVFRAYRAAVEEHFTDWHHVADYARHLGYDVRTLTRATRAATGTGAKTFLDQRILLEAKRLLAHTDLPVGGCARRLGFGDVGNFTTFFRRQADTPPATWRTTHSAAHSTPQNAADSAPDSAARSAARSAADSADPGTPQSAADSAARSTPQSAADSAATTATAVPTAARSAAQRAARSAAPPAAHSLEDSAPGTAAPAQPGC
uniref:helix-turn-helix domain-containing protein n=1 Tax=Nonomuraea pusilla TaxID=46177 RepID=UPI000B2434A7|nr:AraC family transcriptional regulator [Nonomuraea pusilla]